jgi:hypothetical protein
MAGCLFYLWVPFLDVHTGLSLRIARQRRDAIRDPMNRTSGQPGRSVAVPIVFSMSVDEKCHSKRDVFRLQLEVPFAANHVESWDATGGGMYGLQNAVIH